ncbi:MAG TPA: J domain-containing protein [Armatimonadota bacterium]|nr:J domain-containing protein [Armatimonadota bacterium]HOM80228.1 J domain-containing protein [Armatimonadota bacterium]HPO74071.1 J domain-containing protein [Armatimonadota bacterium]
MPSERTHYEILGVGPGATSEEIRQRYRLLAKRYHPDVASASDASAAHRTFVEITAAYEVLIDRRKREAYDRELALRARRQSRDAGQASGARASAQAPPPRSGPRRATPQPPPPRPEPPPDLGQMLHTARMDFAAGRISAAQAACHEILRHDRQNAGAHALLGDICRVQGRFEEALRRYRRAVELSQAARKGQSAERYTWGARALALARSMPPLALGGWLLVLGLYLLPVVYPGSPVAEGGWMSGWTDNLLVGMIGSALLVGFLATSMRLVERPEGELRAPVWRRGRRSLSLGAVLLPASILCYPVVVLVALLLGVAGRRLPRPMIHLLGISCILLLLFAVAGPAGGETLLLGGNIIFPCMVLGCLAGGHFRDAW